MVTIMNYAIFLPACFALNLTFGPNNLLALTHGAQSGIGFALRAGIGRLLVFIPMIVLSGLGLGIVLSASATAFTVLKLIGAVYLIWIGIRIVRAAKVTAQAKMSPLTARESFMREALTAAGNPKAVLIFAAFLPQFVPADAYASGYAIVGSLFLALEFVAIGIYAAIGRLAASFAGSKLHWMQRVSGFGMILFGMLLMLARRPAAA
ncbi:lysine transporter LysE [Acuticoccus sediminis]|uniref:Lysine transporter LysE n=2 Tax=Acuticoccus sediminis TaxID=2184697 RepID=A0A8B2NSV0_9HYPH|nr:lysine transporter LysE [Acuticoccus sediminis]